MIGDVLEKNIKKLSQANKTGNNKFWIILRDIAKEEIISYGEKVDSDIIVSIYYKIMCQNLEYIPDYFKGTMPSNGQERFRVICRNIFTSNAFHSAGLAKQDGIKAYKIDNPHKKGKKIVFQKN